MGDPVGGDGAWGAQRMRGPRSATVAREGVAVEKPHAGSRSRPSRAIRSSGHAHCTSSTTPCLRRCHRLGPRSLVSDSWQRSLAARVDPDRHDRPVVHGRRPRRGPCRPPARGCSPAAAEHAGEHRGRGRARHDRHRRGRDDPLARGGAQPAPRGRLGRAGAGDALVGRRDRHERHGHRAGRRRTRPDPLRRAPGAHRPLLDLRRRSDPGPGQRHAARRDRHQRPLHRPRRWCAGRGHGAAGGEPAAGAAGDRGRAAPDPQHAAPREPARPAGRAGDTDRPDPGR